MAADREATGPGGAAAYGVALGAVAAAVFLRWLLEPVLQGHLPLVTLFAANAVAVWVGGWRPALLAAVLGYAACQHLFIGPRSFLDPQSLVGLVAYLFTSAVIIGLGEAARVSRRRFEELARLQEQAFPPTPTSLEAVLRRHRPRDLSVLVVILTVAVLVAGGALGYASARRVAGNQQRVAHTQEVLAALQSVLATLTQAESGLRGYQITGDARYLAPYDEAAARLGREMARLEALAADDPDQEAQVVPLKGKVAAKMDKMADTMSLLKEGQAAAALALDRTNAGQTLMDQVREAVAALEEQERALLRQRTAESEESVRVALLAIVLPAFLGVLLVGLVFVLNHRNQAQRERAAAVLEEQRERLRVTLSSIGDGVITTDTSGRVTYLNAVAEALVGWSLEEASGQPLETVFPILNERTRAPVENPAVRALREGVIVGLANHTILLRRDGTEHPIDDSAAPIRDGQGRLVGCVLVFRDISARRRAERELWDSREVLRITLASIGDAILTTDPEGRVTFLNAVAEELTGWTLEEASGQPLEAVFDIVNEATRERVDNPAAQALREGVIVGLANHTVLLRRDGTERAIDDSAAPIRDAAGGIAGCVLIFRDITEKRRLEKEYAERAAAARLLASLVESSGDAILSKSPDGTIQTWNAAAERLFGWSAAEAIGRPISILVPEDRADEEERILARQLTGERVSHFDTVRLHRSGQPIPVSVTISPIFDDAGRFVGFSSIARDIAEKEEAERRIHGLMAELRQADRRKDEFLATLAHELRGPLAPIRNMVEILKRAEGNRELVEPALATMDRQLAQMVRLVDDLLDVSRITRNKLELRLERVELAPVVQQAVETCRPLIESLQHEVTVSLPPQPVHLQADPVRLAQVLGNLLNNACKYTEPGGRIAVTAERQGSEVRLAVRDDGIGIPADLLPSVFQMFTQADQTLERAHGGLGIGLTLVQRLVEMHGGTVEASSGGPGLGSEFVVRLPILVEPPPTAPAPSPAPPAAVAARRVLVVDDNRDSAASLAMLLDLAGSETHLAHDGLEALQAAETFRPDVVLLDIGLPRLNGFEVCRRLRQQPWGSGMVLIALTGWGQEEDRRRSTEVGFDHHLVKPVDFATLARLLDEVPRA